MSNNGNKQNKVANDNKSDDYYIESIYSNSNKNGNNQNHKETFVNDLFSIKEDEKHNIDPSSSNFNIQEFQNRTIHNIINNIGNNRYNEYNNKINNSNNNSNNNEMFISNFSSNDNLRVEFANKLFDGSSDSNIIKDGNSSKYTNLGINSSLKNLKDSKNQYLMTNKIIEDKNEQKEEENVPYINNNEDKINNVKIQNYVINSNLGKDTINSSNNINNLINNNINNNNNITNNIQDKINNINNQNYDKNTNLKNDSINNINNNNNINNLNNINNTNSINNINNNINNINEDYVINGSDKKEGIDKNEFNNNTNIINGIDKNEQNLNKINNNIDIDLNDIVSIGDIDLDALPKFNNNTNIQNKNIIKENIDNDTENINIVNNTNNDNDEFQNNLNINEHINNLNLANKIKLKHQNKKKKHYKSSKSSKEINNVDDSNDNSNIPLEKKNKNLLDIFNKKKNKIHKKDKSNKIENIKRHMSDNKNNIDDQFYKRYSNNNMKMKLNHLNIISRPSINSQEITKQSQTIIETSKSNNNLNITSNTENINNNIDNGNPELSKTNQEDINNKDILINNINNKSNDKININNNLVKINSNSIKKEISYFKFLKANSFYNNQNDNEVNISKNNKRQYILNNIYFSEFILKEETIFDKIKSHNITEPLPILYQYVDIIKAYDDNMNDFILLFQYINDKEKNNLYQKYKEIENKKYIINPYLNDFNNFKKNLGLDDKNNLNINNFEYIRYINEVNGDSFYRSFIFNYIEIKLINQNIKDISMLIIDIFKLYDLEPSIFINDNNINMKNTLICFSIIYDFIKVNLWDRAYKFFIYTYNDILDQTLINYMRYNVFLFLAKIDFILNSNDNNENKNKKKKHHNKINNNNNMDENQFDHLSHLMKYNEPSKIIFQSITYIFGVSLNILYYENEKYNNDNTYINNILFTNPYNEKGEENDKNFINIFFCYDNYHICYKKSFIDLNGNNTINKPLLEVFVNNLNILSPISDNIITLSKYTFCEICNKNSNILEIKNNLSEKSETILICDQCLYLIIDEHLKKRTSFLYEEQFKNYIYYLRPISLEIYSDNNKNSIYYLSLSNHDYIHLYKKNFNERISEFMHDICLLCSKGNDLIKIECGCEMCMNCIKLLIREKTHDKIILNKYEKIKLEKKNFDCPLCHKKLNIDNFIIILTQKGINLEYNYSDAIERFRHICQTKCLFCLKKINKAEVENNKIKNYLQFKVKISIEEENNINDIILKNNKLEEGLEYCEDSHLVCNNCYKILNKDKQGIKKGGSFYKKVFCHLCNTDHYIDMKEWNDYKGAKYCCKCIVF